MTRSFRLFLPILILATAPHATAQRWRFFFDELEIQRLIHAESKRQPVDTAFIGVNVIPMTGGPRVLEDQTVLVRGGRIAAIGRRLTVPKDVMRVDARGKFLIPGLVDAHVHGLESDADHLLQLANGVTTVREMCGFPWLLRVRDRVRANHMLAPNSYVAGHILNGAPLGMYGTVVRSPEEAVLAVKRHREAGFDYIKTHNSLDVAVYEAIVSAAAKEGLRVVGHIPHDVSVPRAVAAGQWTMEHFKGYYHDGKLTIAPDDWVGATKGADIWLCPTFSTRMIGTEAETKAFLERPEDRYVSVSARRAWLRSSANDSGSVREKIAVMSDDIFRRLLPVTDRFIAGTDSGGGYRNLVPGFVLLEEIATFERLGMSPYDALRTATVNAARALLDEKEFGTVERGKRADLVLLDRDPRLSAANLRNPAGVMVRGTWLDRQTIRKMLDAVAAIYARGAADGSLDNPSDKQVDALRAGMQELAGNGWIFKDHQIAEAEALFKSRGRNAALRYNFSSK